MSNPGLDDLFQQFQSLFGEMFSSGMDVHVDLDLLWLDVETGATKTVQYERRRLCGVCRGTGGAPGSAERPCERCEGRGSSTKQVESQTVSVVCAECRGAAVRYETPCHACTGGTQLHRETQRLRIPPETRSGTVFRMAGAGHEGYRRPTGSCLVRVTIVDRPVTRRTGDDLEIEVPLARDLARHGGSIRVPGRDGEIEVRIPRRTRDQDEVRLEGLGFARPIDADLPAGGESYRTGMKHGDAIVRWRVPPGPLGSLSPQTITAGVILAAGIAVAVGIGRC